MIRALGRPTVLLAGGGTGGHLFPGMAVAECIVQRHAGARVLLAATKRDQQAPHGVGCPLEVVPVRSPRVPTNPAGLPVFGARMVAAVTAALRVLRDARPDVVVGLGGYGSVAPVLAARLVGLPVVLLEQNAVPGRATRFLSRFGATTAAAFDGLRRQGVRGTVLHTGNPIRLGLLRPRPSHERLGLRAGTPVLAVLGGSLGAIGLNARFLEGLPALVEAVDARGRGGFQVLHGCGPREPVEAVVDAYARLGVSATVRPFFHDMGAVYGTADVVLCRAGGTTLAELMAVGLPSVLVPYPYHADRQQTRNAQPLVESGAASLVEEEDLSPRTLVEHVAPLLADPAVRARRARAARRMGRPDAADRVVDLIDRLTRGAAADAVLETVAP